MARLLMGNAAYKQVRRRGVRALAMPCSLMSPVCDAQPPTDHRPLLAAASSDLGTVRMLVEEFGLSVNERGVGGYTPIMMAAEAGRTDVVRYLAANGAEITVQNNAGRTVFDIVPAFAVRDLCGSGSRLTPTFAGRTRPTEAEYERRRCAGKGFAELGRPEAACACVERAGSQVPEGPQTELQRQIAEAIKEGKHEFDTVRTPAPSAAPRLTVAARDHSAPNCPVATAPRANRTRPSLRDVTVAASPGRSSPARRAPHSRGIPRFVAMKRPRCAYTTFFLGLLLGCRRGGGGAGGGRRATDSGASGRERRVADLVYVRRRRRAVGGVVNLHAMENCARNVVVSRAAGEGTARVAHWTDARGTQRRAACAGPGTSGRRRACRCALGWARSSAAAADAA